MARVLTLLLLKFSAKVQPAKYLSKARPDNVFNFLADIVRSPVGWLQKFLRKFLTARLDLEFVLAVVSGHKI